MRYRFRCEYLGSAFYGWQVQNEAGKQKFITVQSALEEAFSIALRAHGYWGSRSGPVCSF